LAVFANPIGVASLVIEYMWWQIRLKQIEAYAPTWSNISKDLWLEVYKLYISVSFTSAT